MMDSQENILQQEETKEVIQEAAAPEVVNEETAPAAEEQPRKVYETKAEVKDEVDYLKTAFYKLHIAEREAKLKAYLEAGGDPEQYQVTPDELEEHFKAEMGIIKEKRAQIMKEQEAEKQENLAKKLSIIDQIKAMITTPRRTSPRNSPSSTR